MLFSRRRASLKKPKKIRSAKSHASSFIKALSSYAFHCAIHSQAVRRLLLFQGIQSNQPHQFDHAGVISKLRGSIGSNKKPYAPALIETIPITANGGGSLELVSRIHQKMLWPENYERGFKWP